ncbi:hypothetical protein P1P75_01290 [Streptomyces sp. ID05-39B]|uniref:hypothetical protein n=1 Tax=Streptomyces sp. ID05-39B TaxID=3028664 RepID=UPI0029A7DC1A|nr:hypothetical protein [Streptomyces sp. ID05-39B]MDX3525115.1 hypothetical protein [Streptomyces sp. ID05-39B]
MKGQEARETRARLRAEVRLATLREVRKAAIAMDRNPNNDPYLWGYGGSEICKMLSDKTREARILFEEAV